MEMISSKHLPALIDVTILLHTKTSARTAHMAIEDKIRRARFILIMLFSSLKPAVFFVAVNIYILPSMRKENAERFLRAISWVKEKSLIRL